jgi:hypothetical protein
VEGPCSREASMVSEGAVASLRRMAMEGGWGLSVAANEEFNIDCVLGFMHFNVSRSLASSSAVSQKLQGQLQL